MAQEIKKNEATAAKRRLYFHLVLDSDGQTPAEAEAGEQPQISVNGAAGIDTDGVLVKIVNMPGDYYVQLEQTEVDLTDRDMILGTYKSANTAQGVAALIQITDPLSDIVEGTETVRNILRYLLSYVGAKTTDANTASPKYRDIGDTKDRLVATIDADGNRTAVTLDGAD